MTAMQFFYYLRKQGYSTRSAWVSTLVRFCKTGDEVGDRYAKVTSRDYIKRKRVGDLNILNKLLEMGPVKVVDKATGVALTLDSDDTGFRIDGAWTNGLGMSRFLDENILIAK